MGTAVLMLSPMGRMHAPLRDLGARRTLNDSRITCMSEQYTNYELGVPPFDMSSGVDATRRKISGTIRPI